MATTLVIGATGLVGYEFYRQNKGKPGWHFTYRTRQKPAFIHLDANDETETAAVIAKLKPDAIIMPAAYTNVNGCETERELAYRNNVGIVKNVLSAISKAGISKSAKLVFFSTDYLFDGKNAPYSEDAAPNPLNYYGRLKLECEQEIIKSGVAHLIIRTTGIFGWEEGQKNFLYRVMKTLGEGKKLEVPNDQAANATYVRDLVSAVLKLVASGKSGVYNVAGTEEFSKEALARKYAAFFGLDQSLIEGRPTAYFKSIAPRPMRSTFDTSKIQKNGIKVRTVGEALDDMLERKKLDDSY